MYIIGYNKTHIRKIQLQQITYDTKSYLTHTYTSSVLIAGTDDMNL